MAEKDTIHMTGSSMTYDLLNLVAIDSLRRREYHGIGVSHERDESRLDSEDDHWCSDCDRSYSGEWVGDDGIVRCTRCAIRAAGPWHLA